MDAQSVIKELGIERIFSTDGEFHRIDGTEVKPTPLPHGLLTILESGKEELYIHDLIWSKKQIKKLGANAGEVVEGTPVNGYPTYAIQLYRI